MELILLVEQKMIPVPQNIEVVQEFGRESIIPHSEDENESIGDGVNRTIAGTSMYLSGEPEAFIDWLKPFDGVWTCTNPIMGDWKVVHVKRSKEGTETPS